jgi:hypothetical protein
MGPVPIFHVPIFLKHYVRFINEPNF